MIESKVTIIVPVYNSELYLQDTFNSINSQDYENIEVIMVDDGSTDNSFDLMKNLTLRDNRLKIYKLRSITNFKIIYFKDKEIYFIFTT